MENQEKFFDDWVEEHKRQILIGIGVATLAIITYVGWTHKAEIMNLIADIVDSDKKSCNVIKPIKTVDVCIEEKDVPAVSNLVEIFENKITHCPHVVPGHIRKLPEGWNPSPEKIQEALERGIKLPNGYTFVKDYCTGNNAA